MGFSDEVYLEVPDIWVEYEDYFSEWGLRATPNIEGFGDPQYYWVMAKTLWEIGMEEEGDYISNICYDILSEWAKDTGLHFSLDVETGIIKWRDPETGQFVRAPYHDERYLNDPNFRAKYGIE